MFVVLNNQLTSIQDAKISVLDHGFLYGDGVYETLRTVNGVPFGLEEHFTRLKNSARLLQIHLPFGRAEIFAKTKELVQKNGYSETKEARIRWTLTRGENHFDFSGSASPTFLIHTADLPQYPAEPVAVITLEVSRVLPEAKTTSLLPMILGKQKCAEIGAFECIYTEKGQLIEGTVSNFFIQVQNEFWTASRAKVLPGTAANIFQKKMEHSGFSFQEKFFSAQDVCDHATSAYITNSLFGVLAVGSIDGKQVGTGKIPDFFSDFQQEFWSENL